MLTAGRPPSDAPPRRLAVDRLCTTPAASFASVGIGTGAEVITGVAAVSRGEVVVPAGRPAEAVATAAIVGGAGDARVDGRDWSLTPSSSRVGGGPGEVVFFNEADGTRRAVPAEGRRRGGVWGGWWVVMDEVNIGSASRVALRPNDDYIFSATKNLSMPDAGMVIAHPTAARQTLREGRLHAQCGRHR